MRKRTLLPNTLSFFTCLLFVSIFSSAAGISLATTGIAVFGIFLLRRDLTRLFELPAFWPVAFLFLAVCLSISFSDRDGTSYSKAILKFRYLLVSFLLALSFVQFPDIRKGVVALTPLVSILLGTISLLQFFGVTCPLFDLGLLKIPPARIPQSVHFFHARGLLYHHNPFGFGMLFLFYLNLGQILYGLRRPSFVVGSFFSLIGVVASCSRGAWLALLVSGFVLALQLGKEYRKVFVGVIALSVLIGLILGQGVTSRFESIRTSQNSDRVRLWEVSWAMFLESPIVGHGYHESFANERLAHMSAEEIDDEKFPEEPHSAYFDLLGTTGILGFLSFLWFLYVVLKSYFVGLRDSAIRGEDRAILFAATGAFLCFILGAGVDSHFYHTQTLCGMAFGLALGQGVLLGNWSRVKGTTLLEARL